MIDIVIPTYGNEDYTVKCLKSLKACTNEYNIIWVDNGSSHESRQIVLAELSQHTHYISIWLEKNVGFVKAVNRGIDASTAEYIVLLNNDTVVTENWITQLLSPFNQNDKILATGPMTNTTGSWQGWRNVKQKLYPDMPDLIDKTNDQCSLLLNTHFKTTYYPVSMIAFFCTVFKRQAFDVIGRLDERFDLGLGDDDDFCYRIKQYGFSVVFVPGAYVLHNHRTTFTKLFSDGDIKAMQTTNMQKVLQKHKLSSIAELSK